MGRVIAYGYVSGPGLKLADEIDSGGRPPRLGDFIVEVFGEKLRARYEPKPLYDPGNERARS